MSGTNRNTPSRQEGSQGQRSGPQQPARGRREPSPRHDRGQTTLDFAIGVSLFLSVMLFVFAFVPGILQPFNLSGEQDTVISERIASKLSQGMLGDPAEPYVLRANDTVEFFESGNPQNELDLRGYQQVNVSLEGTLSGTDDEILCWDETDYDVDDCPSDVQLASGAAPPSGSDATVTSRRVVSLRGQNVTMRVVVW